ncbi:MAG TPA: hypothetical protein VF411_01230 [Bacteroidia bacterium]
MPTRNISTPIIGAIIVVLKPSTTNAQYIENAFGVHTSIVNPLPGGNTNFTGVVWSVPMATFFNNVTDLDTKQKGMHLKLPTHTAAETKAAKTIVKDNQTLIATDILKHAKLNPPTAQSVIESGGMLLKGSPSHTKLLGAKNTKVPGRVKIIAAEPRHHEWKQLNDDGITWTYLRAGTKEIKTVSGLTLGKSYTFSSAPILSTEDGVWTVYAPIIVATLT